LIHQPISEKSFFVDDRKVSDHHAIIPTEQYVDLMHMTIDERRIYDLVVRRFLAVLYPAYEYEQTRCTNLENQLEHNKSVLDNIVKAKSKQEKDLEKVTKLKNLSDLLKGQVKGKVRTSFETYVQMEGFDGIIAAANKRLLPLSGGQYQLYRHVDETAKANVALNLDILDNHTGKKRPVSSLSGGESFMASLSLALGLSDKVSASAGGIKIDALFIDEGFGTLDSEYLNTVINALEQLHNIGGKKVGIISHVDSLKERITTQIQVNVINNSHSEINVVSTL
jgi:exonuclease SbcC